MIREKIDVEYAVARLDEQVDKQRLAAIGNSRALLAINIGGIIQGASLRAYLTERNAGDHSIQEITEQMAAAMGAGIAQCLQEINPDQREEAASDLARFFSRGLKVALSEHKKIDRQIMDGAATYDDNGVYATGIVRSLADD